MPVSSFSSYKVTDIETGPLLLLLLVSGTRREVRCALWSWQVFAVSRGRPDNLQLQIKIIFTGVLLCPFPKTLWFFNGPILLSEFHFSWQHGCRSHVDLFCFTSSLCSVHCPHFLCWNFVPFAQTVLTCCALPLISVLSFSAASVCSPTPSTLLKIQILVRALLFLICVDSPLQHLLWYF